jgi:hypothetical protein
VTTTGWIKVPLGVHTVEVSRDHLATAMLLWMDHQGEPRAARAVMDTLMAEHGVDKPTAMRLTLVAPGCIERGVQP